MCRQYFVCRLEDLVERRIDSLPMNPTERIEFLLRARTDIEEALGIAGSDFDRQLSEYRRFLNDTCEVLG